MATFFFSFGSVSARKLKIGSKHFYIWKGKTLGAKYRAGTHTHAPHHTHTTATHPLTTSKPKHRSVATHALPILSQFLRSLFHSLASFSTLRVDYLLHSWSISIGIKQHCGLQKNINIQTNKPTHTHSYIHTHTHTHTQRERERERKRDRGEPEFERAGAEKLSD